MYGGKTRASSAPCRGGTTMSKVSGRLAYNLSETARLLGLNRCTVALYVEKGLLPAWRTGGRILIPHDALMALLHTTSLPQPASPSELDHASQGSEADDRAEGKALPTQVPDKSST